MLSSAHATARGGPVIDEQDQDRREIEACAAPRIEARRAQGRRCGSGCRVHLEEHRSLRAGREGGHAGAALARLGALQRQEPDRRVREPARRQGQRRVLRRQLRSLEQAQGRRHPGLRPGDGGRLLAAPLRQAGAGPVGRLLQARPQQRVRRLRAAQVHPAAGGGQRGHDRRAQLLGRVRLHGEHGQGRGRGSGIGEPAVQREVRRASLHQRPLRGEHRARRHPRRAQHGDEGRPPARRQERSTPTCCRTRSWKSASAC